MNRNASAHLSFNAALPPPVSSCTSADPAPPPGVPSPKPSDGSLCNVTVNYSVMSLWTVARLREVARNRSRAELNLTVNPEKILILRLIGHQLSAGAADSIGTARVEGLRFHRGRLMSPAARLC